MKLDQLKQKLSDKKSLSRDEWRSVYSECFAPHPNPLMEMGELLQATLDNPSDLIQMELIK